MCNLIELLKIVASRIDVTESRQASRTLRKNQLLEIPRRHQPTPLPSLDYELEEDDSEREMDADKKIVAVSSCL
jgi:hypothetical protein